MYTIFFLFGHDIILNRDRSLLNDHVQLCLVAGENVRVYVWKHSRLTPLLNFAFGLKIVNIVSAVGFIYKINCRSRNLNRIHFFTCIPFNYNKIIKQAKIAIKKQEDVLITSQGALEE